jgi:phosphatidylinositol alpha-1,6-mannosyltransferase
MHDASASAGRQRVHPAAAILVSERFPPDVGGCPELLGNLYTRLAAGSTPVTVLTQRRSSGRPFDRPAATGTQETLRILAVDMKAPHWGVSGPRAFSRHARLFSRLLSECRAAPSVIHCGRALPEGLPALYAGRLTGVPYLCWTHGEELKYAATSRELRFLMQHVQRHAAAIVANSHNTAHELRAWGVPSESIAVIHPAVDAARFGTPGIDRALRRRFAADDEVLLLTVGRLQRRKGHDLVLRALAQVAVERPKVQYVIVGEGDERAVLERMVRELHLDERVTFVGEVSYDDLPRYYAAADVFVHPNRVDGADVEGFGIVFLEAAAAGLPTIGGATGGVPEAMADGETGFLVSGTDAGELLARIRLLCDSVDLRRKLGDAGRRRARLYFNWEAASARLAAVHEGLSRHLQDRR